VPPYHPDYEPAQDWQDDSDGDGAYYHDDDDDDDGDDDEGERFAEYEYQRRTAHVRRGSEGYEVQTIDREQLLAEYIASRGQEEGHYRRYSPEPPSGTESESSGEDAAWDIGLGAEDEDEDQDDDEPLGVRVEKWRSGEAIS
jgi:palmitoyltransferase